MGVSEYFMGRPRKPPVKPGPSEDEIQKAFIKAISLQLQPTFPCLELAFHPPNGGRRDMREAAKFRSLGVRPGVPDWILPVPRGRFSGLMIEFKSAQGSVSEHQRHYMAMATIEGWLCVVHKDWYVALQEVKAYLLSK